MNVRYFFTVILVVLTVATIFGIFAYVNQIYGEKDMGILTLEPTPSRPQSAIDINEEKVLWYTESDAIMIAKTLWGECRGVKSKMEQAAVAWCVLNRVDDPRFGDTIKDVVTAPYQFVGYKESNPVSTSLLELAKDVLERWLMEKNGVPDIGRVLPKEYVYFFGDMGVNYFQTEWLGHGAWAFDCVNPYKD
jgi:hypothetical protein